MAGWAAVVSRSLCSHLAPGDCHGSTNTYHSSVSSESVKCLSSVRQSSRASPLRIGNASSCCSTPATPLQINIRGSSQWSGQAAASVGAPTASSSSSSSSSATEVEVPEEVRTGAAAGRFGVHVAQVCIQGLREEMEDDIIIQDGPLGFTYAGVFDGHAGFATAEFLRNELYNDCVECLEEGTLLESDDLNALRDAFVRAFLRADERLIQWLETSAPEKEKESGSTATVAFVRNDIAAIAHVGDSRAVLSRNGKAVDLSGDHRPFGNSKTALAEIKRVKEAGAWVSHGRLCATLSVSRAFGDIGFKTQKQRMLDEGVRDRRWTKVFTQKLNMDGVWLDATPEVKRIELQKEDEFIIIASDGLWDSFKSNDAVQFVRKQLRQHADLQKACESIAQAALDRHGQDNISCIILDFGKISKDETPLLPFKFW
ncbi:hypothetical protein R1sor_024320 [Riccia sorocarpa]|uniref:protein-serine/threonine phosphatase n=1 Tax=Riccia sorocarpa TaxID=122646 RepID=A0ABD3GW88_9MARC